MSEALKQDVQAFWNRASCGEEAHARGASDAEKLATQARERYELEPYILPFANCTAHTRHDVLEVGVGMGADHALWAEAGVKSLSGVDLTERAITHTRQRLALMGKESHLQVADAENLPFEAESFDVVYSWGVIHHSPATPQAVAEVYRVLRPGGVAKVMIYHTWSLTGLMLWARFALLKGQPWRNMAYIYETYLESPGTKAYTKGEARQMFQKAGFDNVRVTIQLNHGDLLQGAVGQRHQGRLLQVAKRLWPRWLFKTLTPFLGLYLLIEAKK